MEKKRIVVFTGAGISAESGLKTFRGHDGLWEGHRVEDVATPEAWEKNAPLVQEFYNQRRKSCLAATPNAAHQALVLLEKKYQVDIITQNVDDLHERAGSTRILHLHGEIVKAQSTADSRLVYRIQGDEIKMGERCSKGSQLRPYIVWFGEAVPAMVDAVRLAKRADILIVIGTSLQVYPAANLVYEIEETCDIYIIDPYAGTYTVPSRTIAIDKTATKGVPELVQYLLEYGSG
ncbi:SIR2 family NAD-dependent protein deacylase [Sphingobacterium sp. SYP-B4668]|uniref:SIR2 family NAD-dependent protein deacylase n=1 Tax=Sphingobacterium sp. SYP-B4668 TaxID=2996035 RepID=UPI0022DDD1A2|nr:NAD-dependent deacylase [Sphingobacterium sp. SYP-B4668]